MTRSRIFAAALAVAVLAFWAGWNLRPDENAEPTYGPTGLPHNCRAVVAYATEEYRIKHATDYADLFAMLERNCGRYGYAWGAGAP
jgi:hypothetical protein